MSASLSQLSSALEALERALAERRPQVIEPFNLAQFGGMDAYLQALLDEGVAVADLDGHLLHFNRAALDTRKSSVAPGRLPGSGGIAHFLMLDVTRNDR